MPQTLLLVDCPNQAFRAYHAIQTDMRSPDGFPTRALFGFTRILKALIGQHKPDFIACVFDRGADARLALWPEYKGTRPDMPEDLRAQWPELEPLCKAFGYAVLAQDGVEADDIIGTMARRFASPDLHVRIVSGDKDFCQLVNDEIHLLDVMKGEEIDRAGVIERWGVPPEKVVDLLSLMGDTSDNVPGVPGVGPKKAAQFLEKFGSLEDVLQNATAIGGKTGQAVAENADKARLARKLVEIDVDLPIATTLEDLRPRDPDVADLQARLLRYNFKTLWNELGLGDRPQVAAKAAETKRALQTVWGKAPLAALVKEARVAGTVGIAAQTAEDGTLIRLYIATGEHVDVIPVDARALAHLAPLLTDASIGKVGYDLKPLYTRLRAAGIELQGIAGDVMLEDYLVVPEQKHTLDHLCQRWLERNAGKEPHAAATDALVLHETLKEKVAPSRKVYEEIELPLIPVLARMEIAGIQVDPGTLQEISTELAERLDVATREIHQLAGEEFNINSTQQLATILYDKLGLTAGKKTKTGRSTDAETLEKIDHPLAPAILAFRELYKLKNTYVDALPKLIAADGRIHTTYQQAVAATGRLSSLDPNLQNIPIRTAEGRRVRDCFVAKPGHLFVSVDYSQIELRVLAHYCGEGPLVESFRNGEDIHRRTASEIFGVMPGLVTAEMRRAAKAINFGLIYGMGAFRLGNELKIPRAQAQAYIDGYFQRLPQVRAYMESATARARELGYAETLFGRRRPITGLDAGNPMDRALAERKAMNTPIQGTAADLIKLAMIQVDKLLQGTGATMLLQVHDELVLEVPEGDVDALIPKVKHAMESVASLAVPIVADAGKGRTWGQAH